MCNVIPYVVVVDITSYLPPNRSIGELGSVPLGSIALLIVDLDVGSTPFSPQVIAFGVPSLLVLIGC